MGSSRKCVPNIVTSHPTSSYILGDMKDVDTEHKERSASKAVCLSMQGFDLVVCPFQWSGGDGLVLVSQNPPAAGTNGFGEVLECANTRA